MTANFNPKLNQYRHTQLVDLCRAREHGNVSSSRPKGSDKSQICSTFQSLIHGNSQGQATNAEVAQQPAVNPMWRKA